MRRENQTTLNEFQSDSGLCAQSGRLGSLAPRVCLTAYCGAVNSECREGGRSGPVRTDEGGNYIRKRKERAVGELNARDPREDAEVSRREEKDAEPELCLCDSSEELAVYAPHLLQQMGFEHSRGGGGWVGGGAEDNLLLVEQWCERWMAPELAIIDEWCGPH